MDQMDQEEEGMRARRKGREREGDGGKNGGGRRGGGEEGREEGDIHDIHKMKTIPNSGNI